MGRPASRAGVANSVSMNATHALSISSALRGQVGDEPVVSAGRQLVSTRHAVGLGPHAQSLSGGQHRAELADVLTPDPHPRMRAQQSLNQGAAAALPGRKDEQWCCVNQVIVSSACRDATFAWPSEVRRMRVLLSTIGSRGDVQPMVALALHLREIGHDAGCARRRVSRTCSTVSGWPSSPSDTTCGWAPERCRGGAAGTVGRTVRRARRGRRRLRCDRRVCRDADRRSLDRRKSRDALLLRHLCAGRPTVDTPPAAAGVRAPQTGGRRQSPHVGPGRSMVERHLA